MNQEQTFTITVTVSQLNVIGAGLLELPGKIGNPVIAVINQQVTEKQQELVEQPHND
jgi:hypothetical protein